MHLSWSVPSVVPLQTVWRGTTSGLCFYQHSFTSCMTDWFTRRWESGKVGKDETNLWWTRQITIGTQGERGITANTLFNMLIVYHDYFSNRDILTLTVYMQQSIEPLFNRQKCRVIIFCLFSDKLLRSVGGVSGQSLPSMLCLWSNSRVWVCSKLLKSVIFCAIVSVVLFHTCFVTFMIEANRTMSKSVHPVSARRSCVMCLVSG